MQESKRDMIYVARLHKVVFIYPMVIFLVGFYAWITYFKLYYLGIAIMLGGVFLSITNLLTYLSSSIEVMDNQVVFKSGIIVRRTTDIPYDKIESVDIKQNILGSMIGYGSICVVGSGGSRSCLGYIANPLTCRRHIEEHID